MAANTRKFIESLRNENYVEAKEQFTNIVAEKMRSILAREYKNVAQTYVKEDVTQVGPDPATSIREAGTQNKAEMIRSIQRGDTVTINLPMRPGDTKPQTARGKAVMRSSHGGWVLNMGGRHGTPGIADEDNIVAVRKQRSMSEEEESPKPKKTEESPAKKKAPAPKAKPKTEPEPEEEPEDDETDDEDAGIEDDELVRDDSAGPPVKSKTMPSKTEKRVRPGRTVEITIPDDANPAKLVAQSQPNGSWALNMGGSGVKPKISVRRSGEE